MQTEKDINKILEEASGRYKIERADAVKKEDLINFFKIVYSGQFNAADYEDGKDILKRWEWANIKNPHIKDREFPAWFCKDSKKNEIVGHLGLIPVLIKIKNNLYPAVWGRDMIVSQKWRRTGIASLLFDTIMKKTRKNVALFLLAGLNDYAVSIYKKLGFIHLGYIPSYVRIVKLDTILRTRVQNKIILNLLRIFGEGLLKVAYIPSRIRMHRVNKDILIREISYFDNSFDVLWKKASSCFSIIVSRDSISLNWRFVNQPYWDYKIFRAESKGDGELTGYVVLREGQSQGLRVGIVSDFFAHPDDITTMISLIKLTIRYFEKKNHIGLIRYDILNKKFAYVLKKLGFLNIRSKSHFMVANITETIDPKFIIDRDNWFINYADCDLDLSGRK